MVIVRAKEEFAVNRNTLRAVAALWIAMQIGIVVGHAQPPADFAGLIRRDRDAQESRLGRTAGHPDAVRDALLRAERLAAHLRTLPDAPDVRAASLKLAHLTRRAGRVEVLEPPARAVLYHRVCDVGREMALSNPLFGDRPIVFMKRHRFICQMLHEYMGYYYDFAGLAGGGLFVLERPGHSPATRDLVGGRLPPGAFATPALSRDGKTVFFAFAPIKDVARPGKPRADWTTLPPAEQVPAPLNYFSPTRSCFHVYAVNVDGTGLRRLTDGPDDDFSPCHLPDGGIAFMSSRRGGFCRCNNDFEPLPTYTLHRMNADGSGVQTLSFHETNEWHPAVMNDGRIVYSRWDYVDRSAANYHGLWTCNPDGSNPRILLGNYTTRINAFYQPRAIPGSRRIAFIAGAHHAVVGGAVALVDPDRVGLDPASGEDRYDAVEVLTPEIGFPEAPGWPGSYFHSPWPLSEDFFLTAMSLDPLPGHGSRVLDDTETGIYYFDRFGNLELLYRQSGVACVGPMPLAAEPKRPIVAGALDEALGEEGEFVIVDVRWSLMPLPENRPVRSLRVFQLLPKTTYVANRPRIGYANAESARMMLGTVPVEPDGSAYFRAPARKPLYFQLVDESGRAVQSMRSVTYLQPGERRGCVGCHESPDTTPPGRQLSAVRREVSTIEPGPPGTRPMSFPLLVQPVLDRACAECHDGTERPGHSRLVLTGEPAGQFSRSYESLRPHVRWHEWGAASITPMVTRPGHAGADASPLLDILQDANHKGQISLSDSERRRLQIWLDANAPFYGTYQPDRQQAQREGRHVPPPKLQ